MCVCVKIVKFPSNILQGDIIQIKIPNGGRHPILLNMQHAVSDGHVHGRYVGRHSVHNTPPRVDVLAELPDR